MSKITVKPSGPDRRVPKPPRRNPPVYFEQDKPVTVELTQYIQRRLDDGDLVKVEPSVPAPPTAPQSSPAPPKAE